MKRYLVLILIVLILGIGLIYRQRILYKNPFPFRINTNETTKYNYSKKLTINDFDLNVEIARTDEELSKGLSNRNTMSEDQGMLFVMPVKNNYPKFWMKDMKFPLDLIWISNHTIVDISENLQISVPGTPDSKIEQYSPKEPADYVLEVNSGFCKRHNIKIGQSINIEQVIK